MMIHLKQEIEHPAMYLFLPTHGVCTPLCADHWWVLIDIPWCGQSRGCAMPIPIRCRRGWDSPQRSGGDRWTCAYILRLILCEWCHATMNIGLSDWSSHRPSQARERPRSRWRRRAITTIAVIPTPSDGFTAKASIAINLSFSPSRVQ